MAAVAAANSRKFSAARASPLAKRAMAGSTSGSTSRSKPRPRVRSSIARCRMAITASACSGCSTNTLERESSAAFTSNEGFSVVAPIRTMSPASTRGRNASCCALLKRWISSTNTMVRRPVRRRRSCAAAITSRISLMPDSTALNGTKDACVRSAMSRASVVLPVPWRAPEQERLQDVVLDRQAKRRAGGEDRILPDDLVQRPRAHAFGQRRAALDRLLPRAPVRHGGVRLVVEQAAVAHERWRRAA